MRIRVKSILSCTNLSGNILTCPTASTLSSLTDLPRSVATTLSSIAGAPPAKHLAAHLNRNLPASPRLLPPPRNHRATHRPDLPALAENRHNLWNSFLGVLEKFVFEKRGFVFVGTLQEGRSGGFTDSHSAFNLRKKHILKFFSK